MTVDLCVWLKPEPPLPPPFECVICRRTIMSNRWELTTQQEPVCTGCERHWAGSGIKNRPSNLSRGDHRKLVRFSAVMQALNWEILNGKRSRRSVATW